LGAVKDANIVRPVFVMVHAMNALTFAALRLLSHAEFRSGEEIGAALGVSRTSVSNALAGLDAYGVRVFRLRGRGYRLAEPIEWIDRERVLPHLGVAAGAVQLEVADIVESTNTALLRKAGTGAAHGAVLVAEFQTEGKGRRGRRWEASPGGNLTFSLLWRFQQGIAQLGGLSLAVGVALARAVRAAGVRDIAVKWPNDLVHHYRKLGGILIELQGEALGPAAAVIGVGLNFQLAPEVKGRINQAVTDVREAGAYRVGRNELLGLLLQHLIPVLREFEQHGFGPLRREWQEAHAYDRRPVALLAPSGTRELGSVVGVDEDGALLVDCGAGPRRFAAGEISLRGERD
jgi:BirA family biotin operon repressor/biotin-[acetyl-CoA-carboxylase] ligase